MFGFRSRVSEDMRSWIFDCFDWFDDRFEPPDQLVLPTRAFFQAPKGIGQDTAEQVLADIQRHMKIDQRIEIVPLDVLPGEYRLDYNALSSVAGAYDNSAGIPVIHYDPEQMKYPLQFVNTLAHELMHARLDNWVDDVPGGAGAHELATDLGCIIAGFGVFQLQAADEAGWSGYMTQPTRAFALAVFLSRRDLGIDAVAHYLSSRCLRLVKQAVKQL